MINTVAANTHHSQCKHCGRENNSLSDSFCCAGCESVYNILQSSGLSHYYSLKKDGICITENAIPILGKSDFSEWNESKSESGEYSLYIEGIHCSACVWLLEQLPVVLPHVVTSCNLDLGKSIITIQLAKGMKISAVGEQISKWGYLPHLIDSTDRAKELQEKENQNRLSELGIAGALAGNIMLMSIPLYAGITGDFQILFEWISGVLSIPVLFVSGKSLFKNVASGIKNRTFPIDAPIVLALLVAFIYSWYSLISKTHDLYFDSLSALVFLLLSSRYYLSRLRQSSLLSLGTLDFFKANFKGEIGSSVQLGPDDPVAFDGIIRSGELWVDRSKFTGESLPVHLKAGDLIYAGSKIVSASNLNKVEVLKTGESTRLSELLKKVERAQKIRTITEIFSDKLAKYLLAVVCLVGTVSFITFVLSGMPIHEALTRFLALLIVTCPCALALATPLVFSLAMKTLLKKGVLVKDPSSLDQVLEIKNIFLDKTGTLTEGQLCILSDLSYLPLDTKSILYSLALHSRHPVSRAIQFYFSSTEHPIPLVTFNNIEEIAGKGVFSELGHDRYCLKRSENPSSVHTEVCLYKNDQELVRIELTDLMRADSSDTVKKLIAMGYSLSILSGDHLGPVKNIADKLGIEKIYSELTPEEKANYSKNGVMVGDGFNDALSLSSAKVSVAVQGGIEAAIRSSQVYVLKPGIRGLIDLIDTSKRVKSTLKINFILSTSYNIIGAILSITGLMNPLIAAVLMPLSALSVFSFTVWRFRQT